MNEKAKAWFDRWGPIIKGSFLSGNYGHKGIPGKHGGSAPGGGHGMLGLSAGASRDDLKQAIEGHREARKKPKKEQVPQFETWQEAQKWAEENNLADNVFYKGYAPELCNAINQSLSETYARMPELRDRMQFVGSSQMRNREVKELRRSEVEARWEKFKDRLSDKQYQSTIRIGLNRYAQKVSGNTWALAFGGANKGVPESEKEMWGIGFNDKWGKKGTLFADSVKRNDTKPGNYHPAGTSSLRSVMDHELGHHIGAMLGANRPGSAILSLYRSTNYKVVRSGLSEYAAKNLNEFIAEGWAEFVNSPSPRPLAKQIGTELLAMYERKGK